MALNIGFISTRFAGTDGVSLESAKWAEVLWADKHISYWYAGLLDRDPEISMCVPEAFFGHSENEWINDRIWGRNTRSRFVSERIHDLAQYLKETLYIFVDRFNIDMLILENVLAIPMHVPMGIAITEFLAETRLPSIGHHHDFYWERIRFSVNAVPDFMDMAFPARDPALQHVVINQDAQEEMSWRKGLASTLIPNVLDFEKPVPGIDEYNADIRSEMGLSEDDKIILQPTRIVPRKGIEHSIKLLQSLGDRRNKLVISHDAGDEGYEYMNALREMGKEANVDLRFVSTRISEVRQRDHEGRKIYTLWDIYPHADFVTYPSIYEGFGNAFLEAVYFKVPILINRYAIFARDIEPKGFNVPIMDGFLTSKVINEVKRILEDPEYRENLVEHNFATAARHFGYQVLRRHLRALITNVTGIEE